MPVAFRAFHCMPVRSTKRMASRALLSGTRGLWQPKGWGGRSGRRGSIFAHSQSGIRQPSSRSTSPMVPPLNGGQTAGRSEYSMAVLGFLPG
jgi:hypothetical protein